MGDIEEMNRLLGEARDDLVGTSVMEYCDILEAMDKASQKITEVMANLENMDEGGIWISDDDLRDLLESGIELGISEAFKSIGLKLKPSAEESDTYNIECPRYQGTQCAGRECQYWITEKRCTWESEPKRWACEDCGADQGEFKRNPTTNYPQYPGNCTECGGHVGYDRSPPGDVRCQLSDAMGVDPGPWPCPKCKSTNTRMVPTQGVHLLFCENCGATSQLNEPPSEEPKIPSDEFFDDDKRHEMELMGGAPEHLFDRAVPSIQKMIAESKEPGKHDAFWSKAPSGMVWRCSAYQCGFIFYGEKEDLPDRCHNCQARMYIKEPEKEEKTLSEPCPECNTSIPYGPGTDHEDHPTKCPNCGGSMEGE